MDLTLEYQPVNTEVFEYDGTSGLSDAQSNAFNHDQSDLHILPSISMLEAMKKFNGYELTAQGFRQESSEEKIARLRREIKELEISKNDVSDLKNDLENVVIKKIENIKIVENKESYDGVSNLENRIAALEQALGADGISSTNLCKQMQEVESKLDLLEEDNLRIIDQKLSSVNTKIAGLTKHTLNEDQLKKLQEMEHLVNQLSSRIPLIPVLAERLDSLNTLHQTTNLLIHEHESDKSELTKALSKIESLEATISNFKNLVESNNTSLKVNLEKIETRLSKI